MNNKKYKGIIGLTQKEYENKFNGFYVYAHIYIPTNEILYIGKGCRRRCLSFNRREYYDLRDDIEIEIIARFDDEKEALKREEMEVFYFKYIGMAKYNNQEFHTGKCRGEVDDAVVTEEEEEYVDIYDKYNITNVHNIHLHQMELNMIRNRQYRENLKNLMSNLEDCTQEELEGYIRLFEQELDLEKDDTDLLTSYRMFLRHMKKN